MPSVAANSSYFNGNSTPEDSFSGKTFTREEEAADKAKLAAARAPIAAA
jgi:hypothetical protein